MSDPGLRPSLVPALGQHPGHLRHHAEVHLGTARPRQAWPPPTRIHSFCRPCSGHQALSPGACSLACLTAQEGSVARETTEDAASCQSLGEESGRWVAGHESWENNLCL